MEGEIDIEEDDDLLGQAADMKYKPTPAGKIQIEDKQEMKKRSKMSPDDWDALVIAFAPKEYGSNMAFLTTQRELQYEPFDIPKHWPRVFGMHMRGAEISCVWGAHSVEDDTIYLYSEYSHVGDLAVAAESIRQRGYWIPGVFDPRDEKRNKDQAARIVNRMLDLRLDIFECEVDEEAAITELNARATTKRLKVSPLLSNWWMQYETYRRSADGDLVEVKDSGLMKATGLLLASGVSIAITEDIVTTEPEDLTMEETRNSSTGY